MKGDTACLMRVLDPGADSLPKELLSERIRGVACFVNHYVLTASNRTVLRSTTATLATDEKAKASSVPIHPPPMMTTFLGLLRCDLSSMAYEKLSADD